MKSYKKYYKGKSHSCWYNCIFKRERVGWIKIDSFVYVTNMGWRKTSWNDMRLFVNEITEEEAFIELL